MEIFTDPGLELPAAQAEAVALLALVAGQDVEPAEGSDGTDGRWRIARRVAEDRVISTVDPQARHTRKSPEARRDGYRAHVTVEPDTTLITEGRLTKACGEDNSDAAIAAQVLIDAEEPVEAYGDSAYGTGELRAALESTEHTAVIKPRPLTPAVEAGFTLDDFPTPAVVTPGLHYLGQISRARGRVSRHAGVLNSLMRGPGLLAGVQHRHPRNQQREDG